MESLIRKTSEEAGGRARYITNEAGKRRGVILDIEEYERLLEAFEVLRAADEALREIESGEDELADDDLDASEHLLEPRLDALLYGVRIGEAAVYRIGGRDGPAGTRC